jgi:hypothetical protein
VVRGDLGILSGARRRRVTCCPPETPRKKERMTILNKQTNGVAEIINKTKKLLSTIFSINLKSKPLSFRDQNVMADSKHDPPD